MKTAGAPAVFLNPEGEQLTSAKYKPPFICDKFTVSFSTGGYPHHAIVTRTDHQRLPIRLRPCHPADPGRTLVFHPDGIYPGPLLWRGHAQGVRKSLPQWQKA